MTAVRMITVVAVTSVVLTVLFLAPAALPDTWQHVIYSPASVGLWILAMLFGPPAMVVLKWNWVRHG
ncbi:hypothetical protein ACFWVU_08940 [Streptomyces sp. NPDC058686]|uniref:hypothetical protein n=1 Tax=Streptomyces sp. NPDC058686 TaxID=3346599 RepID=UPI003661FAFA